MKRLLMCLLALLLCTSAMAESPGCWIDGGNADRVHLRAEPSIEADSMGLYYTGTDVLIIESWEEWAWVMVGDEVGYIMKEYLTLGYTSHRGPCMVVDNPDSTWVNLRMSPSMQGMVAMRPENGTAVQLLGETASGWSYVDCEGVKGYILTSLLTERALLHDPSTRPQATFLAEDGTGSYRYIYQYTAPNGQELYFTTSVTDPFIEFVDVNFDGIDDIVVMLASGASNAYYTFFVYDEGSDIYYRVDCEHSDAGFANYQLYPELGIVEVQSDDGSAGALHHRELLIWEDGWLKHLRSATSVNVEEYAYGDGFYTVTTQHDRVRIVVWDYSGDESIKLFEEIITLEEAEYRDIFNEEMEALWQGLR